MRDISFVRRAVLAGALALSVVGLPALVGSAEAMSVAPMAHQTPSGDVTTVQYMRYPHYRYRRFNRHRRAGVYRCGPSGLSTHLERKACR